ncbi:MAG: hypothetical protein FWC40_06285 [Proteobacteria bacterium]|nr:hypothetical protein [Pseudomonadota bacterium]
MLKIVWIRKVFALQADVSSRNVTKVSALLWVNATRARLTNVVKVNKIAAKRSMVGEPASAKMRNAKHQAVQKVFA